MIQFLSPLMPDSLQLPEGESQHCVRVLRHQEDDEIYVVDGRGNRYLCRITIAHPKHTSLEIISQEEVPQYWPGEICLALAPSKHLDRMEWLVEKVTEIGINRIIPLICRFSERKELKTERLKKIAVSAMKQSLKATVPEIEELTSFKQFLHLAQAYPQKFIAHCHSSLPRKLLSQTFQPDIPAVIAIGPEGDFSPEEVDTALAEGFVPISLGDARLRLETAAFVAIDTCHIVSQLSSTPHVPNE